MSICEEEHDLRPRAGWRSATGSVNRSTGASSGRPSATKSP